MYPFLHNGDKILIYKIPQFVKFLKLHDVVVVKNPEGKKKEIYLVKRITQIKENQIYIEGDNQQNSYDSKHYGWVNKSRIVGKMITKL